MPIARMLDEKHWDEWYDLFTEDGHYWVPLTRGQPDAELHNSLAMKTSCCCVSA